MPKSTKETEEEPRGDLPPRPSDEIALPDPDARKAFESREEVDGFRVPRRDPETGKVMSLPQRRAWKKAIEERENLRATMIRELPRASEFLRETVGGLKKSAKEMGKEAFKEVEGLRELGATVGPVVKEAAEDVVLAKPRAKAYLYSEPEKAKEFGRAVVSGDRPAIRKLSEEASKSAMEPFATGGEAVLGGLAAEEGKYGEAAMYGGMLLLPGVLSTLGGKMSKGWLKSAAEAGEELPDEAAKKMNDLAKRVEAGDVTDDMQIRRELAGIEDDHFLEYAQGRPIEDPLQKGGPEPSPYDDPLAAYEFDREPPGYMHAARSGQPFSMFSKDSERFLDDLRTDMAEDTNFGEISSRFYDDLMELNKREASLRSTGKDLRGRELDAIDISNEYKRLAKERSNLAQEYGVGKAEREAALRHEGSYVPPGSKTSLAGEPVGPGGGKPPGGGRGRSAKLSKYSQGEINSAVERLRGSDIEADISNHKFFAEAEGRSVDQEFIDMKQRERDRLRSRDLSDDEIAEHIEGGRWLNQLQAEAEGFGPPGGKPPGGGGVSDKLTSEDRKYLQDKIRQSDEKLQNLEGYPRRRDGSIDHSRLEGVDLVTQQYRDMYQQMLDNDTKLYAGQVVDPDLPSMRGGGKPPGGGRTGPRDPDFEMRREISTRDAFYDDQESGGKLFRIGDRYIEAADVDDALRLATNDDGLEHYVRVPRLDAYNDDDLRRLITEASPEESAKYFEMKRVNPRGDESGFSQPRPAGGGGDYKRGTWSDQYRKTGYTQAHHDRYKFLQKAEEDAFDKLEREGFEPGSQAEDDFLRSMFDEEMSDELLELEVIRHTDRRKPVGSGRVPAFTEDTGIDQYKELVMSFADEGRPFSFTEVFADPSQPFDQDLYKAVDELIAEGRISGPGTALKLDKFGRVLNHDTMIYTKAPGRGAPGGGGRIDDVEGPSEAEIQQMVEASKFGDPEELEMLKEDMRRLAQAEQQGQIARSNIRRTRTPGTPGEFSQPTEGTSRAVRRSPRRERPKKKDE